MTKILQISDTHIVPDGELAYEKVDTAAALTETVATINRLRAQADPIDIVLVTGDLTEHGSEAEYRRFLEIMEGLELPFRTVPGNHDRREPMRAAFKDTDWMPSRNCVNWRADLEDFTVIGLDSLSEGNAHGMLAPDTLAWLSGQLVELDGKPVLLGLHHPPFVTGLQAMDAQNLRNAVHLEDALTGYPGEIRVVCGHVHRSIAGLFAGRFCQICPGTSHAVTLDLRSDANNSLTVEPGAMMLHEWRDGRFLSHLIPVGSFPGPYPFLGVGRARPESTGSPEPWAITQD